MIAAIVSPSLRIKSLPRAAVLVSPSLGIINQAVSQLLEYQKMFYNFHLPTEIHNFWVFEVLKFDLYSGSGKGNGSFTKTGCLRVMTRKNHDTHMKQLTSENLSSSPLLMFSSSGRRWAVIISHFVQALAAAY